MTCKDAIDIIADFLDQTLASTAVDELEAHLRDCEPCRAYLNTYQRTKALTAETERVAMPEEMKDRLRQFLLRALSGGQ